MAALGEFIEFLFYIVLIIAVVLPFALYFVSNTKKSKTFFIIVFICTSSLLGSLLLNRWQAHKEQELEYVGTYLLTNYPNCSGCKLILKKNNTYSVKNGDKIIEEGDWNFRSGGDYWIVEIGEHDQLGSGIFRYNKDPWRD